MTPNELRRAVGHISRGLSEKDGHHYDVLRGKDKTLYFDITAYWQHEYG